MNGLSARLKARLLSEDPFIFQQLFPSLGVVFLLQVQLLAPCEEVRPRVNSRARSLLAQLLKMGGGRWKDVVLE